jgi:hypothetical protein
MMKLRSLPCILLLTTINCSCADTKPKPDLVKGTNLRRLSGELKANADLGIDPDDPNIDLFEEANVDIGIDPDDPNIELFEEADQDETVRKR